ncbi:VC1465 family Xer recombination activation factor, partial [Rhodanobacter caeni]|uniref:VC1465 family Xer recombination activation factor n=1 Tax=Rhodanobacter caeni TaxID=657654 RepID=UPI0031CF4770
MRHACLLNRKACAEYLGVSLRTVRYWDAGRNRVPWSAVRLLRLLRTGDLGALCDEWAGWTINRLGLHAPAGRTYRERDMRHWWLTIEQAHLFREHYEATTRPAAGRTVPAAAKVAAGDPLQPEAGMAAKQAEAAPSHPIGAVSTSTALVRLRKSAPPAAAHMAGDLDMVAERFGRAAAAARSGAGLVSSSKQVERH